jgi:hypothetical protein
MAVTTIIRTGPRSTELNGLAIESHPIWTELRGPHSIPFQSAETPGAHGANNTEVFASYIVPEANPKFPATTINPMSFSYRAVIPSFSVWGYRVSVNRVGDSFVNLTDVRSDGPALTATGTGTMTAANFVRGQADTINADRSVRPED